MSLSGRQVANACRAPAEPALGAERLNVDRECSETDLPQQLYRETSTVPESARQGTRRSTSRPICSVLRRMIRAALRVLRRLGFVDPPAALANLHAIAPTPREVELLAPTVPRLLAELAASPDPDMALNNIERLAGQGERAAFLRLLAAYPAAPLLLARLSGTSQFLADTLRRRPTLLPWLLEARTMRQWLGDELEADLPASLEPFTRHETRLNALRRFKYRHLLRIGCRDILGDADLTVTTEELSRLADVCLDAAWRWAEEKLTVLYGTPRAPDGAPTGLAVIGMGKLGGDELNYSSDVDLIFVYGDDGETSGGEAGRSPNGDFFAETARFIADALESVTEEGHAFRVDLRLRPEGRMGALVLSLDGYRAYLADRAELWERQALIKARLCAGDAAVAARFLELIRPFVFRPGLDAAIVGEVRRMKAAIDRSLSREGRLAPERQARRRRHPRDRVPRPGAPAPLRRRRPVASREEQLARDLPADRARLSLAGPRPLPRRRARPPADGRAPPADPARVPDAHAAGRGRRSSGASRGAWASPCRRRRRAAASSPSTRASRAACTGRFASSSRRRPPPPDPRSASRATPRSRPRASPIPIARARTCGCSWTAGPSPRIPWRRAGRSPRCSPWCSTRSGRRPIPTRPSTSSSASSRRRGRAPRISICSPRAPIC